MPKQNVLPSHTARATWRVPIPDRALQDRDQFFCQEGAQEGGCEGLQGAHRRRERGMLLSIRELGCDSLHQFPGIYTD